MADAGRDTCVLAGQIYELNASGGTNYSWDNQDLLLDLHFLPNAQVQIIRFFGCIYSNRNRYKWMC